jgi:hypothetical protein
VAACLRLSGPTARWPSHVRARDFGAPRTQVAGDLHCDRRELETNHLRVEDFDETGGPAASLSTKDRLERLALSIVCAIVKQDAQSGFRMRTRPDVPLECAHTNHV